MLGLISFLSSLLFSILSGIFIIIGDEYNKIPAVFEILIIVSILFSLILFLISVIFMKINIKYLAIPGSILLLLSIIFLIIGISLDHNGLINTGVLMITPSFIFFMYGYICDKKYHNNIFYKLIN